MNELIDDFNKVFVIGSVSWANDLLRWAISLLKDDSTWKDRPTYKLILIRSVVADLRFYGFKWQAVRLLNQLHLWMKKQKTLDVSVSCKIVASNDFDSLSIGERERAS